MGKSDRVVVMKAVENDAMALQFAGDELKSDRMVVMKAVELDAMALQFASDELKGDQEIVIKAVKLNSLSLWHAGWCCWCSPRVWFASELAPFLILFLCVVIAFFR